MEAEYDCVRLSLFKGRLFYCDSETHPTVHRSLVRSCRKSSANIYIQSNMISCLFIINGPFSPMPNLIAVSLKEEDVLWMSSLNCERERKGLKF